VKQTQRGEDSCFSRLEYFCGKHKNDPANAGYVRVSFGSTSFRV
jgi:hypothetical protein